uniref:Uncharacterized protein n=1 Tax=Plectus sambesii TaxID=2011161 RepID=A0A914WFK3_9BILA
MMRQQVHVRGPSANNSLIDLLPIVQPAETHAIESDTKLSALGYMRPFSVPQPWVTRLRQFPLPSFDNDVEANASSSDRTTIRMQCDEYSVDDRPTAAVKTSAYALAVLRQSKRVNVKSDAFNDGDFEVELCVSDKEDSSMDIRLEFEKFGLCAVHINDQNVW